MKKEYGRALSASEDERTTVQADTKLVIALYSSVAADVIDPWNVGIYFAYYMRTRRGKPSHGKNQLTFAIAIRSPHDA